MPFRLTVESSMHLPMGFSLIPPRSPWGINFGGGLNSTAMILLCLEKQLKPDWILFADTGSEYPGTLDHVEKMAELIKIERPDWPDLITVRWERTRGEIIGFESLHDHCMRTGYLPSKAYGYAGCTMKWKVQPMDLWRKTKNFQRGAFAVGYDSGEKSRIKTACQRGDDPNFTAWYPLVAWGIDRVGCQSIVDFFGVNVGKSSCFICPNLKRDEWLLLKANYPDLFDLAKKIEANAIENGNPGRSGGGLYHKKLSSLDHSDESQNDLFSVVDDRCHHGGCFT